MERVQHDFRQSETVSPFGVGAIVDVRGESLIAPDTSWWDRRYSSEIICQRLLARLGGAGELREPPTHAGPAGKDTKGLLYWRFPAWRFCERCDLLSQRTGRQKGRWVNTCGCGGFLVPMRYVAVCAKGSHVQDVPWFKWTHRGSDAGISEEVRHCRAYDELRFVRSTKRGEGLAALRVECGACRRARPFTDLVAKSSLARDGIRCAGHQPWERAPGPAIDPCDHELIATQRGATGNYIAERLSALDIPEAKPLSVEQADRIRANVMFERVVRDNGGPQAQMVASWISEELNVPSALVLRLAAEEMQADGSPLLDLKDGEWAAFSRKLGNGRDESVGDFVVDGRTVAEAPRLPDAIRSVVSGIGQVRKVREVRALRGFRRNGPDAAMITADLGPDRHRRPVYPAIELFGEGIFMAFDEEVVHHWESQDSVRARAAILENRRAQIPWAAQRLDTAEPRYVALHTLSHLLIRRLAFASGYSSASLQERIYASSNRPDPTAGILIYTASGDAQGTLGGLVRLGEPRLLVPLLVAALDDADVCSNDPVCIESDHQRAAQLNLSACHGCALISETSCETGNRLLDRQLVLGGSDVPGLLEQVLVQMRSTALPSR